MTYRNSLRSFLTGRSRQWSWQLLLLAVVTSACTGCNLIVGLGYFIGGPPSIEPVFDQQTKISLRDDDKTVAVVCFAPKELKFDVDDIDASLARHVAHQLSSHGVNVIRPGQVQAWLDSNDDWDSPAEVGRALEVDWVIYIDLEEYSLFEKNVSNLYRGRTSAMVKVFDMNDGQGHELFKQELVSQYPIRQPVPTSDVSYNRFKMLYMTFLSNQIGRMFYEHFTADDIGHGVLN